MYRRHLRALGSQLTPPRPRAGGHPAGPGKRRPLSSSAPGALQVKVVLGPQVPLCTLFQEPPEEEQTALCSVSRSNRPRSGFLPGYFYRCHLEFRDNTLARWSHKDRARSVERWCIRWEIKYSLCVAVQQCMPVAPFKSRRASIYLRFQAGMATA